MCRNAQRRCYCVQACDGGAVTEVAVQRYLPPMQLLCIVDLWDAKLDQELRQQIVPLLGQVALSVAVESEHHLVGFIVVAYQRHVKVLLVT